MNWENIKLFECCESVSDGDHQPPPKSESGIPFITISNFNNNQIDFTNTMYVPQEYYEKLDKKRKAQKNDILYSVVGSFGTPILVKDNKQFVFQRHIAILRPNNKVVPQFLYYSMLSREFYKKADAVAIGAAQRTISLSALRNMEISIPTFEKQIQISKILSAYDYLIENNQKQIKLLEEAAQRLYKEWFVDLRFPGYEDAKIVDGVPEGWKKDMVNSIITLLSGFAFKSTTFTDEGKYKIVTIKNVQDGTFDGTNVSCIKEIPTKMPSHCILKDGDILLSLTGNVGRVCMVNGQNYLLNQRVAKLDCVYNSFAYCLFRSKEMFEQMNIIANGAAQQNLSPIKTGEIKINIPNKVLLQKFEDLITPMLNKIMILNNSISKAVEARDRLLPKLMNGEIEVTNY